MDKITILIVDDHPMVREGLRSFLEAQDDMDVVAEAASGQEAVDRARELLPQVVLMDLVMPGMDGIAALAEVKRVSPGSEVLVLTSFADDSKVFPALHAGANGYMLKTASSSELAQAIRALKKGEPVLHPDIARKLMRGIPAAPQPAAAGSLTGREMEVLSLLARRLSNKEIAASLGVAEKTVKTHVSSILSKLSLRSRIEAAILAKEQGLGL
jgi:two-component system, NarL family, response regulator LiaR